MVGLQKAGAVWARTKADAKEHGWNEGHRNVKVEQRLGAIQRRGLHQAVENAPNGARSHYGMAEASAQLQVEAQTHVHGGHVERATACGTSGETFPADF